MDEEVVVSTAGMAPEETVEAPMAEMAMVDRFEDGDVTTLIKSGDHILVCPEQGQVIFLD